LDDIYFSGNIYDKFLAAILMRRRKGEEGEGPCQPFQKWSRKIMERAKQRRKDMIGSFE
jgi:hypothetical protein